MIKKKLLNEDTKLKDVFEVDDKTDTITGIKDEKLLDKFAKKYRQKEDGSIFYKGKDTNFKIDDKVQEKIKANVKDIQKSNSSEETDEDESSSKSHGDNSVNANDFTTLGTSIAYGILLGESMDPEKVWVKEAEVNTTKTGLKPEQIESNLDLESLKEKIKLQFDYLKLPDSYFSGKFVGDFVEDMARRAAYSQAEAKKKLKSDVEYTKGEGDEKTYEKIITTDEATKGYYDKSFNDFEAKLAEGIKAGSETVQKGGKITDPITKKSCDVKPNITAKIKTAVADMMSATGAIVADILGLDNKDIFSRMVKYAIGGKSLSDVLRSGTKSILKQGEKIKNSEVKKHNDETIKACAKAEKDKTLPEKEDDNSPAMQAVKKSLEENLNNIITKMAVFSAMTNGAGDKGLFAVVGEEKKFLFNPVPAKESVPLAEDKRRLLIDAIKEFNRFYDKALQKSKIWKTMTIAEKKMAIKLQWKWDAFDAAQSDKFTTDPDVKDRIKEYRALFEAIQQRSDTGKLTSLSVEKFLAAVKEISQDISGRQIKQLENVKVTSEVPKVDGFSNDGKGKENGEQEVPKEVEKDAGDALKSTMAMPQHVADEDYDKKLEATKKQIEEGRKALEDWMKNDEEAANIIMKAIKPIEKYKQQMLPQVWLFAHVNKLKAMFESVLEMNELYYLLTESAADEESDDAGDEQSSGADDNDAAAKSNDDQANKEKEEWKKKAGELLKGIDEILKKEKPSDFASAYESWGKAVTELFNNMAANDKLKEKLAEIKDEDPYVKLCTVGHIVTAKEEKPDNTQGGSDGEGNSESDIAGSKPAPESPDDVADGESLTEESFKSVNFLSSLRNFLKESAKRV